MRILFLCGSLEPGSDGVGDYTRRLAGELFRQGHQTALLALRDKFVDEVVEGTQEADGKDLPVLRIAASLPDRESLKIAKAWLLSFDPQWISLQYVPYAYHKYGMPLHLGISFKNLQSAVNWHVMVHEPYIEDTQKQFKKVIIKTFQKLTLKVLNQSIKPKLIHTSTLHYQQLLSAISINSHLLGLFGNISVVSNSTKKNIMRKNNDKIVGIYFGAAPKVNHHITFAEELKEYCLHSEKAIKLIICGRTGVLGKQFIEVIKQVCDGKLCEVAVVGELEAHELSQLFLTADFGIARVAPKLLGKSGTAIAMLEHGLPMWVPLGKEEKITDYMDFRPELCFHNLEELLSPIALAGGSAERLPKVATKLLHELEALSA